jgi:ATP-binding cassette subfamily C protein LapB
MLTAGLPLERGILSEDLFQRAATRVGLVSKPVVRDLADFSIIDLPAIIVLRGNRPVVLLSLADKKPCRVFMPESGGVSSV